MMYGNPSYKHIQELRTSLLLKEWGKRGILTPLKNYSYPCEITTQAELWHLVERMKRVTPERLAFIEAVDTDLFGVWSRFLGSYGINISAEELHQVVLPYEPIITYLKVVYNRPRPFQTAGLYRIPLYPLIECGSTESAYPSGHTLLSLFLFHKYKISHPELRKDLLNLVLDIAATREDGGVHYPSDNLFSFQVYQHLKGFLFPTTENPYGLQQQNRVNPPSHY